MKNKIEPYKLTENDINLLEQQTPQSLAECWRELNSWGWVDWLGDVEPEKNHCEPDGLFHLETTRRNAVIEYIKERLSPKFLNRVWNQANMTDEEHEAFWEANH